MEFLVLLGIVVGIILYLSIRNTMAKRFDTLETALRHVQEQLHKQSASSIPLPTPPVQEVRPAPLPPAPRPAAPRPAEPPTAAPPALTEEGALGNIEYKRPPEERVEQSENLRPMPVPPQAERPAPAQRPVIPPLAKPVVLPGPSFMERNPDLEKFIGENLISKIGIAILVLAIGFFVKYAIDNDWIGPVGRVGIGVLCGGILVALAHRMRNSYKAFSSVLVGGGLAIFYFTITLAYQQFHLFSQVAGFIIMVVITAFAVVLSLLYDRQELAVIALVGGFATPFMVSNGSGNYKVLFTYLLVLNTGLLVMAYFKAWRLLNLLAFLFTVILFGGWISTLQVDTPVSGYRGGFLFASIFYGLFLAINLAHNIKEKKQFLASDFGILLADTALYFGAGLYFLAGMHATHYNGLFSASIGVFNLALSYVLLRQQKLDKNILYLLIGITLTFISLTAPIQLQGHYITLFWACETVLLYWLYLKSGIPIIRLSSLIVWCAMLVSMLIDWFQQYAFTTLHPAVMTNKGFITSIFCSVATYGLFLLRKQELRTKEAPASWPSFNVFRVSAVIILFMGGLLEIINQFDYYYPLVDVTALYVLLYVFAFILTIVIISGRVPSLRLPWQLQVGLLTTGVIIYLLSLTEVFDVQQFMLTDSTYRAQFAAHWISALLTGATLYWLMQILRTAHTGILDRYRNELTWFLCATFIIYITAEAHLLANQLFYSRTNTLGYIQSVYVKAVMPIIWGVCSFAFMWAGMHAKFRMLRIISLTLFTLTLAKLFAYDIRNIPVAGKIAAFFILGVLLLIVSFMYQRLKTIIIKDETETTG